MKIRRHFCWLTGMLVLLYTLAQAQQAPNSTFDDLQRQINEAKSQKSKEAARRAAAAKRANAAAARAAPNLDTAPPLPKLQAAPSPPEIQPTSFAVTDISNAAQMNPRPIFSACVKAINGQGVIGCRIIGNEMGSQQVDFFRWNAATGYQDLGTLRGGGIDGFVATGEGQHLFAKIEYDISGLFSNFDWHIITWSQATGFADFGEKSKHEFLGSISGDGQTAFGFSTPAWVPISMSSEHAVRELGAGGDAQSLEQVIAASYTGSSILTVKNVGGQPAYLFNGTPLPKSEIQLPLRLSDDGQHVYGLRDSGDNGVILTDVTLSQPEHILARLDTLPFPSVKSASLSADLQSLVLLQDKSGEKSIVLFHDGHTEITPVSQIAGIDGDPATVETPPDGSAILLATTKKDSNGNEVASYFLLVRKS